MTDARLKTQTLAGIVAFWVLAVGYVLLVHALARWGGAALLRVIGGQTAAAWVQAFGTVAAMGVTAAVLYFQNKKAVELQSNEHARLAALAIDDEVFRCNRSLLLLQSQVTFLLSFYNQYAKPHERSRLRALELPPQEPQSFVRVNASDLAFLMPKPGGAAMLIRVELVDRGVEDAIHMMRKRASFYDRAIQPKIKDARLADRAGNAAEIAAFIGTHPDMHELEAYTNSLYASLHNALRSLTALAKDIPPWLASQYAASKNFYQFH